MALEPELLRCLPWVCSWYHRLDARPSWGSTKNWKEASVDRRSSSA